MSLAVDQSTAKCCSLLTAQLYLKAAIDHTAFCACVRLFSTIQVNRVKYDFVRVRSFAAMTEKHSGSAGNM
ncbi:Protein of unknown function [Gryllus bimaculatus]|nr:Protein of unknown function [Gryllus bimaculatus]